MGFSIDSTVGELLDNPATRAFIDKKMPELASNPAIGMARGMSLRAVAAYSGGKLTDEILAAVDIELRKL